MARVILEVLVGTTAALRVGDLVEEGGQAGSRGGFLATAGEFVSCGRGCVSPNSSAGVLNTWLVTTAFAPAKIYAQNEPAS